MAGKISEMTTAANLEETDLFEIAQVTQGSSTGYASFKVTLNAVALKILNGIVFNVLGNKTISNAINAKADLSVIADEYDDTGTYALNAVITFNGRLYKCIEAVEVPEDFDDTKWLECKLVDFLN